MAKRSHHRKTVLEALYPAAPAELVALADAWVDDASAIIVTAIWTGFDTLVSNPNFKAALVASTDDLERGITRLLYWQIDDILSGDEPFRALHGSPEDETRKPAGRSREYDIAFSMRSNPRIVWPFEAKVLKNPTDLTDYLKTIKERFLTCDYSPFIAEGAMAGYLLSGTPLEAFNAIAKTLKSCLNEDSRWPGRYRVSQHRRSVPLGKPYPTEFRCNHFMMMMT